MFLIIREGTFIKTANSGGFCDPRSQIPAGFQGIFSSQENELIKKQIFNLKKKKKGKKGFQIIMSG